jgi:hypothetical protein
MIKGFLLNDKKRTPQYKSVFFNIFDVLIDIYC